MKQIFIVLLSFIFATQTFAKDSNKELSESEKVTVGLFVLFCPMCLPAVANSLAKSKPAPKKEIPVRGLASKYNSTSTVSKKEISSK